MAGYFGMCGGNDNMSGKRFGSLVATSVTQVTMPSGRQQRAEWLCVCDCGNTRMVPKVRLIKGITTHCGCQLAKNIVGMTARKSAEYRTWVAIRQRCYNPKNQDFEYYGGKGVRVHARWHTFANFFEDMGRRPEGTTIDRIKSDGDYEPGNCRWATMTVQNNNSSNCRRITFKGEELTLTQWAARLGIGAPSLSQRLKNWTLERALTTPRKEMK